MEHTRRRFKVFIFLLTLASCAQGQLYCYVCDDCENTNGEILQYCGPKETSTVLPEDTTTTVPPEATTTFSTAATTTVPPEATTTSVPPEATTTVPTAATTTVLPEATTTSVPPEATTTVPTAATTTVPPEATTTSVPPEVTTSVPPEATTTVPTAATTTVPPEATTSVPPEATTSVPPEATTTVPTEATTTVPTEATTALSSEATPTTKEATTISEDQTATSSGDGITITLSNQLEETTTITEIAEVSLNTLLDEIPTFGDFSISRRRRDTSGTVYACYSIALKGGGTAKRQVNRGCLAMPLGQNGCGFLKQENNLNASQVENCLVCQNDGCNGSAIAKLSGLALLAALVLQLLQ